MINTHTLLARCRTLLQGLRNNPGKSIGIPGAAFGLIVILASCGMPSTDLVIPPGIPGATFVGSKACADCHETLVRDFKTADHARLQAKGKNAENVGCETCHGPGSQHVNSGGAANTIINPRKSPETCFQCHLEVRAKFHLPSHHPVLEGKMNCADCHNPHKGSVIKGGGTNMMTKNDICFQCHTAQKGPFVFQHEAIREGCTVCHDPHGSVNPKQLTERNQTLCLKCHFQQQKANGVLVIGNVTHAPDDVNRGACWSGGCHEGIHGSQTQPHLKF